MKKKLFSIIIAVCLVIATVPTIAFASNSQSTSPIKIRVAPSEHEKSGWNVEWSESFEQGIPSTWQNIDNDGDGYKWWKVKEEPSFENDNNSTHHGDQSIHSNSYLRVGTKILEPDNWLILPEQNLSEKKIYSLTFDIVAFDGGYLKDKIGIYISTDGGNSYTQLGDDFDLTQSELGDSYNVKDVWQEVEVDLSAYSGKKVTIAIVHHNSRDEYMVVMDCMYMWSKDKHMHCVCGGNTDFNGHDTHTDVEWSEWNSTDSLPTASGNYYLANDINLATAQSVKNDINICLNGKTIKSNTSDYAINVNSNASLTITDCTAGGKLECWIDNDGSFNMYAGTLQSGYELYTEPDSKMALSGNSKFIGNVISIGNAETKIDGNSEFQGTLLVKELTSDSRAYIGGNAKITGKIQISNSQENAKIEIKDNMIIDGDIEFYYFTLNSNIVCNGNIISGIFKGDVENNGTITGGTFLGKVTGNGTIADSATVNVNFNLDGGTGTTLQKVLRGQKLTEPTKPYKSAYTFDGWYNGEQKYNFDTPVFSEITLTAKWKYVGNSSSGSTIEATTEKPTEPTTMPTTKPNKQNNSKNAKDKTDKTDKNSLSAGAKKADANSNNYEKSPLTGNASIFASIISAGAGLIILATTKKRKD
ncbi:choice-of-anchor J domain-containing protein [uncultured Eubacterium sp.]|uniref:choice-of-anchor J domain-containing protein n=2 Tax=uncultured Eubacterium sp. TaxID=165185 RepID=UPI002587902B|nr:choice-of-anchor J domain-containing protein [uncultured Eubacterium sp.]